MRGARTSLLLTAVALAACGPARAPSPPGSDASSLAEGLEAAFEAEAHGSQATAAYVDVLGRAATMAPDGWQLAVTTAALDALVFRSVAAFATFADRAALVHRTADPSLTRGESLATEETADSTAGQLARVHERATGPFVKGLVAEAMTSLAEHRGDADDAARWREASGCAREATVVGPLDWAPVTGVDGPDPLAAHDAKMAAGYPLPGAFAVVVAPVVLRGHGCAIELAAANANPGVRDVVVDVEIKRAQRIGVSLRSAARATLRAGGALVIDRPYELGGGDVARFAWVDAAAGVLRLVARVGMDQEGEAVRLFAWDENGRPLRMRAPRVGDSASVAVSSAAPVPYPAPRTPGESLTVALAALASQDPRSAESLLSGVATKADAAPALALAYGRAIDGARDLSLVRRTERGRAAYEGVLSAWPDAWEAIVAHAWLAGVARGPADARFAELADLARLRAGAAKESLPLLDLFEAAVAGRERLGDRAAAALARVPAAMLGSSLGVDASRAAVARSRADEATFDCSKAAGGAHARESLACYAALRAKGDLRAALAELDRLRAVRGGTDLFLPQTLRDALALGDRATVERAFRDMLPAERTLADLYGLASLDPGRATPSLETREQLLAAIPFAHDAPIGITPLLRALRDDPTAAFAGIAEAVVHDDRLHPVLPDAATAVLEHRERYDVSTAGVVHAIIFDLRRVGGTTDVEENAQAGAPQLSGRTALRILRRRVLKHDGTTVEPDPNPGASQGHADLAQLEAGDVVEAIYEGWSIPIETGEIGIDTVDLLPARTAVHSATVELHLPASLPHALSSHPLLGAPVKRTVGTETVLTWSLADRPARRVEDATSRMDRSVAVSFSTVRWPEVARGLREALAARVDHDPSIGAWATAAVDKAGAKDERARVDAVVAAVGAAVKEGDPGDLSDLLYGHALGPQESTARGTLLEHQGSRTWLVVRALRELGISCEVLVAENEPWSATPGFPPHLGRFMHPLAIAHVKASSGAREDVPIDADVSGPPLPAGHISPELRGRQALHEDGSIAPVPDVAASFERDEIDERFTVDAAGDARGTFTVLLRGRDAQDLAGLLEKTVGDSRQRALRAVVLGWVPFANVDSVDLSSSEGSWQVALRALVSVPGYAQREGRVNRGVTWSLPGLDPVHYVYPRGYASTLSAAYATEGARESALAVTHAVQYHAHRRVELPPGASVVSTPGAFEVRGGALNAARALRVDPDPRAQVVEDDFVVSVPTGTVPATGYASFVSDAHRTDDAFLAGSRFGTRGPLGSR